MSGNHHIWRGWAKFLHRWGLEEVVAALLEALGPLTLVGAQAVYFSQPFLGALLPDRQIAALAQVLEDRQETEAFVLILREAH